MILAVAGVFSGGDDDGTDTGSETTTEASTDPGAESSTGLTPELVAGLTDEEKAELTGLTVEQVAQMSDEEIIAAAEQRTITPVKLDAVGGSGVAGVANFGLASDQLFIDLDLEGLDPNVSKDDTYVIWMMLQDEGGYPVSIVEPERERPGPAISTRSRLLSPLRSAAPRPRCASRTAPARSSTPTSTRRSRPNDADRALHRRQLAAGKIPLAAGGGSGAGDAGGGGEGGTQPGSSLPGFMIPAGSSRSLTARSASRPSSPISAAM